MSVYLDSAEPREQQDPNWHVCAQFALLMSNPNDPTVYTALSKNLSMNSKKKKKKRGNPARVIIVSLSIPLDFIIF